MLRARAIWQGVRNGLFAALLGGLYLPASHPAAAAEKAKPAAVPPAAQKVLEERGLRLVGGALLTDHEQQLRQLLSAERKLRKEVNSAEKQLNQLVAAAAERKTMLKQRIAEHRAINARLPRATTAAQHNQMVAALNEAAHQIQELGDTEAFDQQLKAARATYAAAREKYIGTILEARKAADAAADAWRVLPEDPQLVAAIKGLNRTSAKPIALAPGKALAGQLKSLAKLEGRVLSDTIPLRNEGGNTFVVDVVLSDGAPTPMVFDSGASLVCLPYQLAIEARVPLDENAEELILSIADGTQVPAKKVILPSLRVGKFEAKNVEAAVLPPQLVNAPALLGMSYLRNFQFSLDSDAAALKMSQLTSGDAPAP